MGRKGIRFVPSARRGAADAIRRCVALRGPGTDKAIKDIVTGVGYIDVPNFLRKFKKAEGITLGQYRQLYANTNDKAF